jgi:hypothetical protein
MCIHRHLLPLQRVRDRRVSCGLKNATIAAWQKSSAPSNATCYHDTDKMMLLVDAAAGGLVCA